MLVCEFLKDVCKTNQCKHDTEMIVNDRHVIISPRQYDETVAVLTLSYDVLGMYFIAEDKFLHFNDEWFVQEYHE